MTTKTLRRALWMVLLIAPLAACKDGVDRTSSGSITQRRGALVGALSGTVFGGGAPLAGAGVEALEDGTTNVVASSVTNAQGHYTLDLDPGTYDLRVTPPAASGLSQQTVQEVAISQIRVYDIILIQATVGVRGTVTGYGGGGVSDVRIDVEDPTTGARVDSMTTDASGAYSFNLGSGTYRFYLTRFAGPSATAPDQFYGYRWSVAVSGPTTFDVALPVIRVDGHVTDAAGPVAGAVVYASSSYDDSNGYFRSNVSAPTDATGRYQLLTFTGMNGFSVTPPPGSGDAILLANDVTLVADATRDFTLSPSQVVSGVVTGYGGGGVSDVRIDVEAPSTGARIDSTTTNASGGYSFNLGAGTYRFYLTRFAGPSATAPDQFYGYRWSVAVSGPTTFDVALPVVRVDGHVTDVAGPVADAVVYASSSYDDSNGYFRSNVSALTDATGRYQLLTFTGMNGFSVTPPPGSGDAILLANDVTLVADATRDFTLSPSQIVSGVVTGYGGGGVSDVRIDVEAPSTGARIDSTTTNASGGYSFNLGAGTYRFYLTRFAGLSPTAPDQFYGYRWSVAVSGPTAFDLALPVVRVDGRVTDFNGASVPNVVVSGSSSYDDSNGYLRSNASALTDVTGHYRLTAFKGQAGFTIIPPAGSGFATTLLSNVLLDSDRTQAVILAHPDVSPPAITSGPLVIHLSDTSVSINWTTNEASTSRVEYGVGGLTSSVHLPALTTAHAITLVGLQPSTDHLYLVKSTDAAGNPVQTGALGFRTQDPPGDVAPPLITSGPIATFVADTGAIVSWQTDEPASSVVHFGTSASLGGTQTGPSGVFVRDHSVTVTGLSPATQYLARVESTDPDGNGPTQSGLVEWQTLATPDRTPPAILAGPTIQGVTDHTITVSWTTDEPATSGVSYNDGTAFDLAGDAGLVTNHVMTLSQLKPGTLYQITVSSTDAVGNGPTLGGPVDAMTSAVPDTTPPVLSGLSVTTASGTTATVAWTTDELATSSVTFGTVQGAPDGVRADVALVTAHAVLLTGLVPGQTYYLSASSTDASGNTGASGEASFIPGDPPGAPCLAAAQCATGICVDGVCCQSACGGDPTDCQACSVAAGGSVNGICTVITTPHVCRPSAGACDVPESCDGAGVSCPADGFLAAGSTCGPEPRICELAGACGGGPTCSAPTPVPGCFASSIPPGCESSGCPIVELRGGLGVEDGITVQFQGGATPGEISVEPCDAESPPPTGYRIKEMASGIGKYCWDLKVGPTVAYSTDIAPILVCIHYPEAIAANEAMFQMAHDAGSGIFEVNTNDDGDPGLNTICGFAYSLSPFVLLEPADVTPPGFSGVPASPVIAYATSTAGARVTYAAPMAVDGVDGPRPVACSPAPGAMFPPGKTTVTCSAADLSGNANTATFTVWVQYQAPADGSFFLAPIRANGSSVFRIGRPVPVKFKLTGTSKNITDLQARLVVTKISDECRGTADDESDEDGDEIDFLFKYRKGKGIYAYRWKTRDESRGTYRLRAVLGDGVVHEVIVSLKVRR